MTNKEIMEAFKEHDTRLTSLEKWRWFLTGGLLTASVQNFPILKEVVSSGMAWIPTALAMK